jgi:hypothetical protein
VYKHFGREIIASELKLEASDPTVEKIYLKVYKQFMEALDGIDNGVNQWCGSLSRCFQQRRGWESAGGGRRTHSVPPCRAQRLVCCQWPTHGSALGDRALESGAERTAALTGVFTGWCREMRRE